MDYLTSNEIKNREFEQMCTFADVLAECRRDLLRGFWDDVPQRELRQTLNSLGKHGPEHFKLRCRLYFLKWERHHWTKTKTLIEQQSVSAPHREYLIKQFADFYRSFLEKDRPSVKDARMLHELNEGLINGLEELIKYDKSCQELVEQMDDAFDVSERRLDHELKALELKGL